MSEFFFRQCFFVSRDAEQAFRLREMIRELSGEEAVVQVVEPLPDLASGSCGARDIILIHVSSHEAEDGEAIASVVRQFPETPVLVLGTRSKERFCRSLIGRGVSDYLIEDEFDGRLLGKTMELAFERMGWEIRHRKMSGLLSLQEQIAKVGSWELKRGEDQFFCSDAVLAMYGLEPGETLSVEEAIACYPPEHQSSIREALQTCWESGQGYDQTRKMILDGGKVRWVRSVCQPVMDGNGTVIAIQGTTQDITQDFQKTEELELLKESVRHLNDAVVITEAAPVDEPGPRIVFVNEAFVRMTGYGAQEAVGRSPRFLQGPATGREACRKIRQALEFRHSVRCELLNYRKDGTPHWIEMEINPIRDGSGQATHFVSVQRDIDERKRMEQSLMEQVRDNFELRQALDRHAVVAITDTEGTITFANDKFCQISGYSREELIGQNHRIMKSDHHPPGFFREMWECIRSGLPWQGEVKNRTKSGQTYWMDTTIVPLLDESGTPRSYLTLRTDITKRKEAEQQLQFQASLIDKARDAILVTDMSEEITFWNQGAEQVFGWSRQEALGQKASALLKFHEEDWLAALQDLQRHQGWAGEIQCERRDGEKRLTDCTLTIVETGSTEENCVLAIHSDITEKKGLERQFFRAQRMESIGRLAGGIAHDLNNMLAPILISISNLRDTEDPEAKEEILELMETSAQRAAGLIRQVLSFSRGVEGKRIELDVAILVGEIASIIEETFPKSIHLEVELPGDLWSVHGDATQIYQVLMNICVNARDAMPEGGTLKITAGNESIDRHYSNLNWDAEPGTYVAVSISDQGQGISKENIDKIFEPFFTTKPVGEGSGIGLSTCSAIVKSHGGFIHVYSEAEKGTTFRVYFPSKSDLGSQVIPSRHASASFRGDGQTLLVVDDEQAIRLATCKILQRYGFKTLEAGNGAEAAALFAEKAKEIDLVLTDMAMPIMDGYALIIALRSINSDVKIIATSGLASNGGLARAMGAGVKHFIAKPFTADNLLSTIGQALEETGP